tara:strand:+ start:1603 stop:1956 length:354 start_codon:yes stop_codon:yes gene_type:complete
LQTFKNRPRKRHSNRAFAGQGFGVNRRSQVGGGAERPIHAWHQIGHDFGIDPQLPVGEMLDQQGRQQGIVRRRDLDRCGALQARGQVRQGHRPARGRCARRDQNPCFSRFAGIEEME